MRDVKKEECVKLYGQLLSRRLWNFAKSQANGTTSFLLLINAVHPGRKYCTVVMTVREKFFTDTVALMLFMQLFLTPYNAMGHFVHQ